MSQKQCFSHFCDLSCSQIALDNKYSKIVLGSCTSGLASHIISSTVKVCQQPAPSYVGQNN